MPNKPVGLRRPRRGKKPAAVPVTGTADPALTSAPETPAPAEAPPAAPKNPPPPALAKDPVESFRWGWYFLSVLIPLAGIWIGLFLYDRDSRAARRVGRNSLLIGFVLWILLPLALSALLVVLGAVSALGLISSLMPLQP